MKFHLLFILMISISAHAHELSRLSYDEIFEACHRAQVEVRFPVLQYASQRVEVIGDHLELSDNERKELKLNLKIQFDSRMISFILLKSSKDSYLHSEALRKKYRLTEKINSENFVHLLLNLTRPLLGWRGYALGAFSFLIEDPVENTLKQMISESNHDFLAHQFEDTDTYQNLKAMRENDPGSVGISQIQRTCALYQKNGLPAEWYQRFAFLE